MTGDERDVMTVYTEDVSTGRVHIRIHVDGALLTDERDNLDDAGEFREIGEAEAMAKPADLRCQRCFPTLDQPKADA